MIYADNDLIAVEPFKSDAVQKTGVSKGFATIAQKTELTGLKVVFGTQKHAAGITVWVRGDLCATLEGKAIYEVDGKKFILIPEKEIKLWGETDAEWTATTSHRRSLE